MKAQKIAVTGILAAIICLLAPFSFPVGAVPISLATFAIYITACTVNYKLSAGAVIIYILLGAAGLPVFSAFRGGIQVISGLTGGFILGYIPCALVIGILTDKFSGKKYVYPLSMVLGTLLCSLTGTLWYMAQTGVSFFAAAGICILPFIPTDIIKIAAASAIGITLRKRLSTYTKNLR